MIAAEQTRTVEALQATWAALNAQTTTLQEAIALAKQRHANAVDWHEQQDANRMIDQAEGAYKRHLVALTKHDLEMMTAKAAQRRAVDEHVQTLVDDLLAPVARDKKVRSTLLEVFGLSGVTSSSGGWIDWASILAQAFPEPSPEEADRALSAARKRIAVWTP